MKEFLEEGIAKEEAKNDRIKLGTILFSRPPPQPISLSLSFFLSFFLSSFPSLPKTFRMMERSDK